MKKMKTLLLAAICLVATNVMTSCLNDSGDDFDYTMTPEEETAYLTRLSGNYTGKMYFAYRGRNKAGTADSAIVDSIPMAWRFNRDSTMTIANFPDSVYNNMVKGNTDVRKILKHAPNRQLTCYYAPYKGKGLDGAADYGFYIIAKRDVDDSNTNYAYTQSVFSVDGKEYTAKYGYVSYLIDGYARIEAAGYQSRDGKIEFSLLIGKLECNNVESFTSEAYRVRFVGEKLY